jgi:hypothetical protein
MTSSDSLNLHDDTLLEVRFNWGSGECIVFLKGSRGPFQVAWSGVKEVHLPRRLDWGPSVSVLSATQLDDGETWVLVMQSGDAITIRGKLSSSPHCDA